MKIAVIHDWLVVYGGAERVLEQILYLYPSADVFTLVDFLPEENRGFLDAHNVSSSFIEKMPWSEKYYRQYLVFMPLAIEQFDLSKYDLIISSSAAISKGVITGPNQLHISYCHTPIRYAWDLQFQYLKESGLDKKIKGWIAKWILHKIRIWDYRTANGVDEFVANSKFIGRRITKLYRRNSTIIYPPVDVDKFTMVEPKEDFYLTASRMVPYKKIGLIVEAFSKMPDKKLVVIGNGPEMNKIRDMATSNIEVLGYQSSKVLRNYMERAKAFVFAALEDFGITPVEAQACGAPVIAYGKGGVRETVINGETGVFYYEQDVDSIIRAVAEFEVCKFDSRTIRKNAEQFSKLRFRDEFKAFVDAKYVSFLNMQSEN